MRLSYWRLVLAILVLTMGMMGGTARAQTRDRYGSGDAIAQTALRYVGYPYAWVGDTPQSGFSCVGFTHWVFAQWGIWTPESAALLAWQYPYVSPANLRPGDVLIFANTAFAGYSHAAIYIGGGHMVGANNFQVGVHVDSIYDAYWYSHWATSVRVLRD